MKPFKQTFLYIKQHSITGKCYFGKTTQKDPIKYKGGGLRWSYHLKKHGHDVETLWYCLFIDQEECTKFAESFSKQEDIANSDLWLNLKHENGLDGGGIHWNGTKSIDHQSKITLALTGKKFSESRCAYYKERYKGCGNPRALLWTIEDQNGNILYIKSLKTWCRENSIPISSLIRTKDSEKFFYGFRVLNKTKVNSIQNCEYENE